MGAADLVECLDNGILRDLATEHLVNLGHDKFAHGARVLRGGDVSGLATETDDGANLLRRDFLDEQLNQDGRVLLHHWDAKNIRGRAWYALMGREGGAGSVNVSKRCVCISVFSETTDT